MITKYLVKIEDKIKDLEYRINIDIKMAEANDNWGTYYPYLERNIKELDILKKALKVRNKLKNVDDEDF